MLLSIESHGVFSFIGLGAFQLTASAVSWGGGSMSIKRMQTELYKRFNLNRRIEHIS